MYKISDFSSKTGLSVKTLRYYDEINLLKPSYSDLFTGYRYYEDKQMNQVETINKLKAIDLSLEEIKQYLESKDISIIEKQKKGLEQKLKKIEDILKNTNDKTVYGIYSADYKKYVEVNGTKKATCPQALEVRDNNARYYIIEKNNEFDTDFCLFKENNWITLDINKLLDKVLKKQLLKTLSLEYDEITFIVPKESKETKLISKLFKHVIVSTETQTSHEDQTWDYHKLKIILKDEIAEM